LFTERPEYTGAVEFRGKSDVIAATLRELIITGEVEPGTPLRQRDLAMKFGVSPTPVREALRRLEAEGLVHHDLHRGATVIEANLDADEEGYMVRAALESLAARQAAKRVTEQDIADLEEIHRQLAGLKPGDPEIAELNRRFHFRLYEASRSPVLLALLRLLWQSYHQSPKLLGGQAESVKQHGAIIEALRKSDEDAAEKLMRAHIGRALELFLADKQGDGKPKPKARRARKPAAGAKA
jgi:DNA-binding GntR family transcriptional regulator